MKKVLTNFTLILLISIIFDLFLPWWSIMIAALFASLIVPLRGFKAFLIPFCAVGIYWLIYSFMLTSSNDFILAKKIGILFNLGENWLLVLSISSIIGGIVAGVSGLLGNQIAALFRGKGS